MSEESHSTETEARITELQSQLQQLSARVAKLEAEVETEHEDIELLKAVTDKDHRRIRDLKQKGGPVGPIGL